MTKKGRRWLDELRKKIKDLIGSLEDALTPQPELIPVPARPGARPHPD